MKGSVVNKRRVPEKPLTIDQHWKNTHTCQTFQSLPRR